MTMLLTGCGLAGLSKFSQIDGMHDLSVAAARVYTGGCRTLTAADKTGFVGATANTTRKSGIDFWFSAFIKPTVVNITQYLFHDGGDAAGSRGVAVLLSNATLRLQISNGSATANYDSTATIVADVWTHILIVADRSGNATFYVNGVAAGTADISARATDDITSKSGYFPTIGGLQAASNWFGGSVAQCYYGESYLPVAADVTFLFNTKNGRSYAEIVDRGGSLAASMVSDATKTGFAYQCNETDPTSGLIDQAGTLDLTRTAAELLSNTGFETRTGITGASFVATDKANLGIADGFQTGLDPLTGSFSLVFMFKITSLPATAAILYDKFSGSTGYSAYITSKGTIVLPFGDGTGVLSSESISTVTTGVWYSCIVTYDRSGYAKLYIGAASITEYCSIDISAKTASLNSTNGFGIGCHASPSDYWFSGVMAMVGYADELLTEADRTEYHNSRLGKYYNELSAGLKAKFVSFWDLTDGPYSATQTAHDFVGTNDLSFRTVELVTNGAMTTDASWTKGTGWTVDAGDSNTAASDGTQAADSDLEQACTLTTGRSYDTSFVVTRTAGKVCVVVGGTEGTDRESAGTFTQTITVASTNNKVAIRADADFVGTVDTYSVKAASLPLASDADLFWSWTESSGTGCGIHAETINTDAGSNLACKIIQGSGGYGTYLKQEVLTVGNTYNFSMRAKSLVNGHRIIMRLGATDSVKSITTAYASYDTTGVCTSVIGCFLRTESSDGTLYIDTISCKATSIAVGNGPAEAIAEDSVGTNHGTLTGFTPADLIKAWTTDTHNDEGYALTFDGTDDYVSFPQINCGTVHTLSMWLKSSDNAGLFLADTSVTDLAFYFTGGNQYYQCGASGQIGISDVNTGTWRHLAVVRNGLSVNFYVNGEKKGETQTLGTNESLTLSNIGGYWNSSTVICGAGIVDDLRIYNVALSAAQVAELYTLDEDEEVTGATMVAQWRFNDGPFGQPADGDPVLGLLAKDGTALFQQSTAAQRPTYARSVALLNNQPAIRFTKASVQYLDYAGGLLTAGSGYIAFVIAIPAGGDVTTKQSIFCSADEGTASYYLDVYIESGVWKVAQKNNDAEVISVTSTTACAANAAYFVEIESDGTTVTVRINNVAQTLSNATQDWFGDTTLRDNFTLGVKKTSSESGPFDHYLAAIELLDRQPTTTEKALIRSLSHRTYGVP